MPIGKWFGGRGAAAEMAPEIPVMIETEMRWLQCTAEQIEDGRTVERDGVVALISPKLPAFSVYNIVVYRDPESLRAAIDDVTAAYGEAGVTSWAVLVHPGDNESGKLLKRRGHKVPGGPHAMAIDLDDIGPRPAPMDLVPDPPAELAAQVNARAYGYPPGAFEPLFHGTPRDMTAYVAMLDGKPVVTLQMVDVGEDSGLFGMATDPDYRRRGLARDLLFHALHDARERGRTTSTLQASVDGEPLYASMGYRRFGRIDMWQLDSA